jgi:mono/diheme cytochrome c family protein
MWKESAIAISMLVSLGLAGRSQEKPPTEFKIPPEEASRKNPLASSPTAIAEGKRRYGTECAVCHGTDGDGKGDVVEELKLKLRDWRDPTALKDLTDGEMFYIINKGKGAMPGEGDRAKPEQIWQMVIYLRSLAKSEPPAKPTDVKPPA